MAYRASWSMVYFCAFVAFLSSSPGLAAQTIEIEINNTPDDRDDYLGWTPVRGRIRQVGGMNSLPVTLESTKRDPAKLNGEVQFAGHTADPLTPTTFEPAPTLTIELPADGVWKGFWVAGKESSADGKDVQIIVKDGMGTVLKQHPLMVRVRKDAETLTELEVTRFLETLAQLHDVANGGINSKFVKYVKAHEEAFSAGIHQSPGFTPWHRAFLLSLERELQSIDPRVALPYWKFDAPAPKLFSRKFLGVVTNTSSLVEFESTNPINGWSMPSVNDIISMPDLVTIPPSTQPMVRGQNGSTFAPDVDPDSVADAGSYSTMRFRLENNYHNEAHNHIGGWLASGSSPRDPLFFLLHNNVDRAWAQWQKARSKFDPDGVDQTSYSHLGSYPGPGVPNRQHAGNYANDSLWPWNGSGGNQGTSDPGDDWPNFSFPITPPIANHGPDNKIKNFIDYLDVNGRSAAHNVSYDTVRFK